MAIFHGNTIGSGVVIITPSTLGNADEFMVSNADGTSMWKSAADIGLGTYNDIHEEGVSESAGRKILDFRGTGDASVDVVDDLPGNRTQITINATAGAGGGGIQKGAAFIAQEIMYASSVSGDGTAETIPGVTVTILTGHLGDATIHFTQAEIDHTNLLNIGSNTHAQIDSHIATTNIHFTDAPSNGSQYARQDGGWSLVAASQGIIKGAAFVAQELMYASSALGTGEAQTIPGVTVTTLTTHLGDSTIHFTEASIDHTNIQNVGINTHAQIDAHIASTANPHSVTAAQAGAEPDLGNPASDGYVLSSTALGVRSWVAQASTPPTLYSADGTIADNRTVTLQAPLTFDGNQRMQLGDVSNQAFGAYLDLNIAGAIMAFTDGTDTVAWNFAGQIQTTQDMELISQAGTIKAADDVQFDESAHFGTEIVSTPTGTTQTITLSDANHQTLNVGSATGAVTATLNVPPGSGSGSLILKQGATGRNIIWATNATSLIWLGTQPTWVDDTNKTRIVSWRYDGTDLYLMASETN